MKNSISKEPQIDQSELFQVDKTSFEAFAKKVFLRQYRTNKVYKKYCELLNFNPTQATTLRQIPFLPISAFKNHRIASSTFKDAIVFYSSGTTANNKSVHHLKDLSVYENSFTKTFESNYGKISDYALLALLPSYMEQKSSSLIYMVNSLMQKSKQKENGFFLNEHEKLKNRLEHLIKAKKKTILIGVSFALLDFMEKYQIKAGDETLIVMETGGMKGRRKEISRMELHRQLKSGFGVKQIHSEYGMTELLSQAYAKDNGRFYPPPWMRVLIRKADDPFTYCKIGETGGINIIDLANLHSVSFIQTDDLGKLHQDGSFEVLGRFDQAEIRGCNLMNN